MTVATEYLNFSTKGGAEVINITSQVAKKRDSVDVNSGTVTISVIGSTGALTTCEYEPGLIEDIPEIFDKLIPQGSYHHDRTWGDGNGHSHLRASLLKPSLTIPIVNGRLTLGTWQQILFIDFDIRARQRRLIVQVVGDLE